MKFNNGSKEYLRRFKRLAGYFKDTVSSARKRNNISLHYYHKNPSVEYLIVPDFKANEKDIFYAERLLSAFHKAIKDFQNPENDIWTNISRWQAKFFGVLKENNPKTLAQYLCNMNKEDATIGTVQGKFEFERLNMSRSYRKYVARNAKDKLIGLAEAFGVLPVENPEQGSYGNNIYADPAMLLNKISAYVGQDITPPDIDGGLLKLKIGNALISERDCTAIYTGYLMKDSKKICEIGGGAGRTCLWASRFGVSEYIILDLPQINVVQGFYLLKSMNDAVSLYGESAKQVIILPCHQLPEEKFDLILNQDSFPEIDEKMVVNYLEWIKDHTTEFLSINFESKAAYPGGNHLNVSELVQKAGGFERKERIPFWLRKGYVVERYLTI